MEASGEILEQFKSLCAEEICLPAEEHYIKDDQLHRLLVARNYNIDQSFELWKKWVEWRKTYRADLISEEEIAPIYQTGSAFIRGRDKQDRPCIIIRTRYHWPKQFTIDETMRYIIYITEKAIQEADQYETGQVCVIYDRENMTSSNRDYSLMELSKKLASMFQDVYAERLGAIYVLHINWFYKVMYQAFKYLLHKKTRDKIHVVGDNRELLSYFEENQLMCCYGGSDEYLHAYPTS